MKNKRGITLVALVITIIILLILAGITITQLTENGLFEKVKLAKDKSEQAQEKENVTLEEYENTINEYVNGGREQITIDKDTYEQLIHEVEELKVKYNSTINFIDYSNLLTNITTANASYTATQNCAIIGYMKGTADYGATISVDGVTVCSLYSGESTSSISIPMYVKKGSVITTREYGIYDLKIYGLY